MLAEAFCDWLLCFITASLLPQLILVRPFRRSLPRAATRGPESSDYSCRGGFRTRPYRSSTPSLVSLSSHLKLITHNLKLSFSPSLRHCEPGSLPKQSVPGGAFRSHTFVVIPHAGLQPAPRTMKIRSSHTDERRYPAFYFRGI
jgi:hypothetical protein